MYNGELLPANSSHPVWTQNGKEGYDSGGSGGNQMVEAEIQMAGGTLAQTKPRNKPRMLLNKASLLST